MNRKWIISLAFFFLSHVAQATSATAQAETARVLRFDGIGGVKVGMSLAELNGALKEHFEMPADHDDQGCFYVTPAHYPQLAFMVEDGRVSRIDVTSRDIRSDKGIRVGDSEAQVHKAYGKGLKQSPNPYLGKGGHYITIQSGKYGLRFEIDHGKVTTFYAGRFASIQYIEGCL